MKLTPWFGANQNPPMRDGWYDIRWHGQSEPCACRLFFSRGYWYDSDFAAARNRIYTFGNGNFPGDAWRGLTEPAK